MRVTGKHMALGVAAAIPAVVAGAFAWSRLRDREEEPNAAGYPVTDDPRFVHDGTE